MGNSLPLGLGNGLWLWLMAVCHAKGRLWTYNTEGSNMGIERMALIQKLKAA